MIISPKICCKCCSSTLCNPNVFFCSFHISSCCRYLFENFSDSFRNTWMHHPTQVSCSPNNNIYAKLQQHRFKQTIVSARGGGVVEATKRLLSQLPISAQSYSNSPYLDSSLFSYDDKWVSMLERPKGIRSYFNVILHSN